MRAELVLLGRRVDMARRSRRRVLVAGIYAGLALVIALTWWIGWGGTSAWVIWAVMLACRFFLGGYYRGGLVKPFAYRKAVNADGPPSLLALKLRVYQPVLRADEDAFRNDERELIQRDRAHYLAYQTIGVLIAVEAMVASMRSLTPKLLGWIGMTASQFHYGISMVAIAMFLTLPQSILLWTEPDMEEQGLGKRE